MLEFVGQVVGIILAMAVLVTWMTIPTSEKRDIFDKSDIKYRDGDNT